MGMGQIMGFNYKAAGYDSAKEMFEAFSTSEEEQIKAMIRFISNNPRMLKALQDGDLETFIRLYNGPGQVKIYLEILNKNLKDYKSTQSKKDEEKDAQQKTEPVNKLELSEE